MGDFFKGLFLAFVMLCAAGLSVSIVKGDEVDSKRPYNEDAYGWYEYHITHAEDEMERLEYDMGLSMALFNGALTDSEYETLHALAEQEG